MATPKPETPADVQPYTVLRAICIDGERVETGSTVNLSKVLYTELFSANKVGPYDPKAEAAAEATAKAKLKAESKKKADPTDTVQAADTAKPAADLLTDNDSAPAA